METIKLLAAIIRDGAIKGTMSLDDAAELINREITARAREIEGRLRQAMGRKDA